MAELTVPQIDFSALGQLPQIYKESKREQTLANLGKGLAEGTVDYKQAGATLASLGDINGGLSLMKMGEEEKAGREFSSTIGGMYGQPKPAVAPQPVAPQSSSGGGPYAAQIAGIESGGKYDAMGPLIEAGPMAGQRALGKYQVMESNVGPWTKTHLGREMTPAEFIANPEAQDAVFKGQFGQYAQKYGPEGAAKAWFAGEGGMNNPNAKDQLGTTVSAYAGKFTGGAPAGGMQLASLGNGMPTPDTRPAPQGVEVAQNGPPSPVQQLPAALMQDPSTQNVGKLLAASVNPRLPAAQKEVAKTLLAHALKASELTSDQKEYIGAVAQGEKSTFTEWVRGNKKSGATNITIDQKGEAKFEEEFGKKQADRWSKYIDNADAAERKMVDINTMREISTRVGSQGVAAGVKEALGPYAEAAGINIEGLSDIQAYTQVMQRLAPQQRAPGSGSTSDIEFKGFLKSLPGLAQNPAARETGLNTMEALARDEIARGEIASRLSTKEINRVQAEKELRALPDPMKGFVDWRKANPQLYGAALKGGTATAPAAPAEAAKPQTTSKPVPQVGHTEQGFRFKGGDPSRQENWEAQR